VAKLKPILEGLSVLQPFPSISKQVHDGVNNCNCPAISQLIEKSAKDKAILTAFGELLNLGELIRRLGSERSY
jgi:hypothetical protein